MDYIQRRTWYHLKPVIEVADSDKSESFVVSREGVHVDGFNRFYRWLKKQYKEAR